jgi:hypothetical protein
MLCLFSEVGIMGDSPMEWLPNQIFRSFHCDYSGIPTRVSLKLLPIRLSIVVLRGDSGARMTVVRFVTPARQRAVTSTTTKDRPWGAIVIGLPQKPQPQPFPCLDVATITRRARDHRTERRHKRCCGEEFICLSYCLFLDKTNSRIRGRRRLIFWS